MKTKKILWALPLILLTLIIGSGFTEQKPQKTHHKTKLTVPDDIQSIIDHSCIGCHNVDAKNEKSKKKLMFDKLAHLSKAKIVAKLSDISDVVAKGDMPPEKFLAKYPDKGLTDEQAKALKEWADITSDELMK